MAIKVGEVYVEVFPRINAAARRAAVQGIANAFRGAFDDIDRQANVSADNQVRARRRAEKGIRDSVDRDRNAFRRFGAELSRQMRSHETLVHRLATKFRTFGTILRGLSLGAAVIGGLRLVTIAIQGIIALMPVLQAALLSIPFAIGAIGVEAVVLGIAFKGVGKAIGLAFDPSKADKFQDVLDTLSPSARKFVLEIKKAQPVLSKLQESLFSAPALQRAASRFGAFMKGLDRPLQKLARDNGNLIGRILGTFTDNRGLQLSVQFVNLLGKIIRGVTPGLVALTRAFQILAVRVAGQVAQRIGGINGVLEKLAHWLTHIDIAGVFHRAHIIILALKPAAINIKDIFTGIVRALGGWQGASGDFIGSVTEFTARVSAFVNSKRGQEFVRMLRDCVKHLSSLSSQTLIGALNLLFLALQAVAPLLSLVANFAKTNPGAYQVIASAILTMAVAWKIYSGAAKVARAANLALGPSWLVALGPVGALIAALIILAAEVYLVIRNFKSIASFFRRDWPLAWEIAAFVVAPMIGLPHLIISKWESIVNFFGKTIPHWFNVCRANVKRILDNMDRDLNAAADFLIGVGGRIGSWFSKSLPNFFRVGWHWAQNWGARFGGWFAGPLKNFIVHAAVLLGNWFSRSFPNFFKVGWHWVSDWTSRFGGWFAGPFTGFFKRIGTNIGRWFTGPFVNFFKAGWRGIQLLSNLFGRWFGGGFWSFFRGIASRIGSWFKRDFVGFFKSAWDSIMRWTERAVGEMWKKLKRLANDVFVGPWDWIVRNVANPMLNLWNKVAGVLGLPKILEKGIPRPHKLAGGGFVSGPGGPREDKIPAMLSNGEYVVNAEATARHYALLAAINAGRYRDGGVVQGFAKGGPVWPSIVAFARHIGAMSGLRVTSTTSGGHAPGSYHYKGMAVDVAGSIGAMNAAAQKLAGFGRYFLELIHEPGIFWKNGRKVGRYGGPHADHIHMAMNAANAAAAMKGSPAAGGGGGLPAIISSIFGFAKKGITYFKDPIMKVISNVANIKKMGPWFKDIIGKGVPMMLNKGASMITSKVVSFVENFFATIGNFVGGFFKGPTQFHTWFIKAINAIKLDHRVNGNWTNGLQYWEKYISTIAKKESNYNPNAINRWDINARHGDPSRGIMQTIGTTFVNNHVAGTSGNIYDPVANIAAAIVYIHRKYGTVMRTPWFTGRGTYYKDGGPVNMMPPMPRKVFDNGGPLPPGFTMAYNGTGQTEWVNKNSSEYKELHVHVMDKHFVAQIDDRIAKHDDEMIKYIITRHH